MSRVSQGGEGVPRRVSPAENRRLLIESLRAGRCDVARQAGWDLAVEEIVASLRRGGHPEADRAATFIERTYKPAFAETGAVRPSDSPFRVPSAEPPFDEDRER